MSTARSEAGTRPTRLGGGASFIVKHRVLNALTVQSALALLFPKGRTRMRDFSTHNELRSIKHLTAFISSVLAKQALEIL